MTIVAAGWTSSKSSPCTALTASAAAGSVKYIRVRMTAERSVPASPSAVLMISKQRRACSPGSVGHEPSGQIGPVPDTSTRSPTRTAREKPMLGTNGEPDVTFLRACTPQVWQGARLCPMAIGLRHSRATAGRGVPPRGRTGAMRATRWPPQLAALVFISLGSGVKESRPCSMLCTAMPVAGSPSWLTSLLLNSCVHPYRPRPHAASLTDDRPVSCGGHHKPIVLRAGPAIPVRSRPVGRAAQSGLGKQDGLIVLLLTLSTSHQAAHFSQERTPPRTTGSSTGAPAPVPYTVRATEPGTLTARTSTCQ
jgi:hypothetical protein